MSSLKILTAAVAAATFSLAFAQANPPRAATDPAQGAGQRSTQNTPMGSTGTPSGGAAMQGGSSGGTMGAGASGASGASGSSGASGAMNSGSSAGASSGGGTTMAAGSHDHNHKASTKSKKKSKKAAKADRS